MGGHAGAARRGGTQGRHAGAARRSGTQERDAGEGTLGRDADVWGRRCAGVKKPVRRGMQVLGDAGIGTHLFCPPGCWHALRDALVTICSFLGIN
eukprot:360633-Chlamydomonas_euryale.AAC.2